MLGQYYYKKNNENMNFIYILELRDEELNVDKIITIEYATYAVAKRKIAKNSISGFLFATTQFGYLTAMIF